MGITGITKEEEIEAEEEAEIAREEPNHNEATHGTRVMETREDVGTMATREAATKITTKRIHTTEEAVTNNKPEVEADIKPMNNAGE